MPLGVLSRRLPFRAYAGCECEVGGNLLQAVVCAGGVAVFKFNLRDAARTVYPNTARACLAITERLSGTDGLKWYWTWGDVPGVVVPKAFTFRPLQGPAYAALSLVEPVPLRLMAMTAGT